jgi:hypothetical protein
LTAPFTVVALTETPPPAATLGDPTATVLAIVGGVVTCGAETVAAPIPMTPATAAARTKLAPALLVAAGVVAVPTIVVGVSPD